MCKLYFDAICENQILMLAKSLNGKHVYLFSSAVPSGSGACQMPTRPSSASSSSAASSAASTLRGGGGPISATLQ